MIDIVLPVFNEQERIGTTLESIFSQDLIRRNPNQFEVLVIDSNSTDDTIRLAGHYPVGILQAPKGKLQARRVGIEHARGDIIVAADGDSYYPQDWLGNLLRHFADPQVVAVCGPRLYDDVPILNIGLYVRYYLFPKSNLMNGGNSAFKKQAFYQTGGFRSVNELDPLAIQQEEEYDFGDRLAQLGRYVYDRQAACYTSSRRWWQNKHAAERQRGERF